MNLTDFKTQYPQYADVPDGQLAGALYEKYYKPQGVPESAFRAKIGYRSPKEQTVYDQAQQVQNDVRNDIPTDLAVTRGLFSDGQGIPIGETTSAAIAGYGHGVTNIGQGLSQLIGFDSADPNAATIRAGARDEPIMRGLAQSDYGTAATVGELAGAIGDPIGLIGGLLMPWTKAKSVVGLMALGAGTGALYGAGSYVGEKQSRGMNALLGAGLGAVAVPATHVALTAGKNVARRIGNKLRGTTKPLNKYPHFRPKKDDVYVNDIPPEDVPPPPPDGGVATPQEIKIADQRALLEAARQADVPQQGVPIPAKDRPILDLAKESITPQAKGTFQGETVSLNPFEKKGGSLGQKESGQPPIPEQGLTSGGEPSTPLRTGREKIAGQLEEIKAKQDALKSSAEIAAEKPPALPTAEEMALSREQFKGVGTESGSQPITDRPVQPAPPEPKPASSATIKKMNLQVVDSKDINVNPTALQFKKGVDPVTGEQKPLQGEWDPGAAEVVTAWQDKSGKLWAVNGHHRVALANRTGGQKMNVNILKEADGVTIRDARARGAELNIKGGQGTIKDHAAYFRENPKIGRVEAEKSGVAGKGYEIARNTSDDVYGAFTNGQIDEKVAYGIAKGSEGDVALGREGLAYAKSHPKAKAMDIEQYLRALKKINPGVNKIPEQSDIFFSPENQAIRDTADKMAETVTAKMRDIEKDITAMGSGRTADRAQRASKGGIKADPKKAKIKLAELKAERDRWSRWHSDPELFKEVQDSAGLSSKPVESTNVSHETLPKTEEVLPPLKEGKIASDGTDTVVADTGKSPLLDSKGFKLHSNPAGDPALIKASIKTAKRMYSKFSDPLWEHVKKNPGASGTSAYGFIRGWDSTDDNAPVSEKFGKAVLGAVLGYGAVKGAWRVGKAVGKEWDEGAMRMWVPDHGVPEGAINLRHKQQGFKNSLLSMFNDVARDFQKMPVQDQKLGYQILTGEQVAPDKLTVLTKKGRDAITKVGQMMVDYGLLSEETFKKNVNTYLHRSYTSKLGIERSRMFDKAARQIRILGDELRPRGIVKKVSAKNLDKYFKEGYELFGKQPKNGKTAIVRRQLTKKERVDLGEIENAAFAVAETGRLMSNDVAVFKYYDDIAKQYSKAEDPGILNGEAWLQMNENTVGNVKGSVKQYGNLAGKWLPESIANDIMNTNSMRMARNTGFAKQYRKVNAWWKATKTAYNPTVHMNNVMSNFGLYYMADANWGYLPQAYKELGAFAKTGKGQGFFKLAEENGVFDADMLTNELQGFKNSWMEQHMPDNQKGNLSPLDRAEMYLQAIWKKGPGWMSKMYQKEDHLFRLALFIDKLKKGVNVDEAALAARRQFIDYEINARGVEFLRNYPLPFIAFTYRVIPILAETAIKKPWKFVAMAMMGHALNGLGEMEAKSRGIDVEKERRLLPDRQKGTAWGVPGMFPTSIRIPFTNQYLDVTRWIAGGDVFDVGSRTSSIPGVPDPFNPSWGVGGSFANAAQGFDAFLGKRMKGLGRSSWSDAKIKGEKLIQDLVPNFPYVPGAWSTKKINKASNKVPDASGYILPVWQALAQSVGIKIRPADIRKMTVSLNYRYKDKVNAIKEQMHMDAIDYRNKSIDEKQYRERMQEKAGEIRALMIELHNKLRGSAKPKPQQKQTPIKGLFQPAGA